MSMSGVRPMYDAGLKRTAPWPRDPIPSVTDVPLVIDLDGTLLKTDLLLECILAAIKLRISIAFRIFFWALRGPAVLKQELARCARLDTSALPLNSAIVAYASGEKARGRQVFLATAADRSLAQPIAERCGFFDGVLASDGRVNLKGTRKLEALTRRFPEGFAYAGDSQADMPIWHQATQVVLVGTEMWTRRIARRFTRPTLSFPTASRPRALAKCMRPHQWAKNALVFAPAVLSGMIADPRAVFTTTLSFLALCLVASATYILNDLWDLTDDRRHWSKCRRPVASGALPIATAMAAAPGMLLAGLLIGFQAGSSVGWLLLCYLALTLCYSFALKRVPVMDVTVLAALFTLRLVLGGASAHVFASPWLLAFSMFLFSSLCFAKRYVEVSRSVGQNVVTISSRGYQLSDHSLVFALGTSTAIASIVVIVFYIIFDAFQQTFLGNTEWLWAFPVILYLWLARIWLLATRGELDDDPVAFAVRDTPSLALGSAILVAFLLAWLGAFA